MIKFLDLAGQYNSIKEEIDGAIHKTLNDSAFIGGARVKNFEESFAHYQHSKYCVGVGNGTDAIEIALEALALPKGSEVIVPANSFIASSEAVTRSGLKVVFCDNEPNNYTISISSLKEKITSKTSAIIAVHLYGHPADMDTILKLAQQHNLKVVEDCAQAHAAEYRGCRVGAIGHIGTFSFYPGKNLGAYGDGGAIVTNDKTLSIRARMIANHGRKEKYDHTFEGRNSRLDGLQAAVLSVKLKHLDLWTEKRIQLAKEYLDLLEGIDGLILPKREEWAKQVYHLFVIRVSERDKLKEFLSDNDIQSGVHYPIALPKLEAYGYIKDDCSNFSACKQDRDLLSLPIGEHLSIEDIQFVCSKIKQFFSTKFI
ncbi:DegT/DnrJ/EryC1/StrS family aminotransferase [Paraglaciecola chathamensis]|uniref:Daunorubicin biosynthesis sensory transduction protein dnrJ n=1 Tax=Paraglaciecola chathamensis S18K6 TaxID=1127672 RepID=A0AAV3V076_9ALTE|nr:DegT/DnrJ/EryC1/StrS family aminotransferase [Paraglaciecola chathamensis]GAC10546.1 daunorubicin biosynthesis sensory transduction protein dnrJ [Paraglaciecola chathamensis S18K6]